MRQQVHRLIDRLNRMSLSAAELNIIVSAAQQRLAPVPLLFKKGDLVVFESDGVSEYAFVEAIETTMTSDIGGLRSVTLGRAGRSFTIERTLSDSFSDCIKLDWARLGGRQFAARERLLLRASS
jgi:hypothetical protein